MLAPLRRLVFKFDTNPIFIKKIIIEILDNLDNIDALDNLDNLESLENLEKNRKPY